MERVSQRHGKNYYRVIPVFKEDGVTEIDQFWIYNGTGKYGPGSKGDTAIVLDLTGMTKNDAVAALKEVGLVLGNITYVISDNEKGVVENQDRKKLIQDSLIIRAAQVCVALSFL